MYVILTDKPGKFHTEMPTAMSVVESYEYRFYGKVKAIYRIAILEGETKVRIVEDESPYVVNDMPSKFLEKYPSIEDARKELAHLTHFGSIEASLVQCPNAQVAG